MRRFVLTTFGSLGDLHPFIALALELQKRGRPVLLATSENYREKLAALGIPFAPMRPGLPDFDRDPAAMARYMDLRKGTERILLELVMPSLRQSYDDLAAVVQTGDVLVSHALTFATSAVAEKRHLPWASVTLQPLGFFSAHDPPCFAGAEFLEKLRILGPRFNTGLLRLIKSAVKRMTEPIQALRAAEGLPRRANPLFEGQYSPALVLALFSRVLGAPQPDWPKNTVITGFPDFDRGDAPGLAPELERFLEDGDPPVVFTLGSSAVHDARDFYTESAAAAKMLGKRAVFLTAKDPRNQLTDLPRSMIAVPYAPFSLLFPRAAATVHQGGAGTTAQALRAGKPMIVVPYAHDQPDNALRCERLGIARSIPRRSYSARIAAMKLAELLGENAPSAAAARIGELVRQEDGAKNAVDALEKTFGSL